MTKYDTVVIGGGPGGYIAAIRSSQLGKKTLIVENSQFGGTCLNLGCIPTKALLHSSEIYSAILHSKDFGISVNGVEVNYKKMCKKKDKAVKNLRSGVENLLMGHGVDIIRGTAKLTDNKSIEVNDEKYIADNIILAMGSRPFKPNIPGVELPGVVTSDSVLTMDSCPESITIIGGGVIGTEFATLFNALGKKVTIIEMMPTILYGTEADICKSMESILTDKGIEIHTNAKVLKIEEGLKCIYSENGDTKEVTSEMVVVSVGRTPNTNNMGLEAAGIKMERGFVAVNEQMQTSIPNVYAVGDITGKIQLAHVATSQGIIAATNISGKNAKMNYNAVPSCIYTSPEIACVGLTEAKAIEAGYEIKCGSFNVSGNGRAMAMGCNDGFAKIVSDSKTGRILGCHILAPSATEMIGEAVIAIENGMKVDQIASAIHPHPTVSEIIMEAAHDIEGLCCHKL